MACGAEVITVPQVLARLEEEKAIKIKKVFRQKVNKKRTIQIESDIESTDEEVDDLSVIIDSADDFDPEGSDTEEELDTDKTLDKKSKKSKLISKTANGW